MTYFVSDPKTTEWILKYNKYLWEITLCYNKQGFENRPEEDRIKVNLYKIVDEIMKDE